MKDLDISDSEPEDSYNLSKSCFPPICQHCCLTICVCTGTTINKNPEEEILSSNTDMDLSSNTDMDLVSETNTVMDLLTLF